MPYHEAKDEVLIRFERDYLRDLLARAGGNLSEAARKAGLERKFLYKLLDRAGLRRRPARPGGRRLSPTTPSLAALPGGGPRCPP